MGVVVVVALMALIITQAARAGARFSDLVCRLCTSYASICGIMIVWPQLVMACVKKAWMLQCVRTHAAMVCVSA